jgi:hypothetical protein
MEASIHPYPLSSSVSLARHTPEKVEFLNICPRPSRPQGLTPTRVCRPAAASGLPFQQPLHPLREEDRRAEQHLRLRQRNCDCVASFRVAHANATPAAQFPVIHIHERAAQLEPSAGDCGLRLSSIVRCRLAATPPGDAPALPAPLPRPPPFATAGAAAPASAGAALARPLRAAAKLAAAATASLAAAAAPPAADVAFALARPATAAAPPLGPAAPPSLHGRGSVASSRRRSWPRPPPSGRG